MHRVEFFYDVVSPYSWLAFETLCRYRQHWDLDLRFRPFLLAGVMKTTGNAPPAELPARAIHMARDLGRNAEYYGVPLRIPSHFPRFTIKAMRLLTAVCEGAPARLESLSRRLWELYWSEDRDITRDEVLHEAMISVGIDHAQAEALLARIASPEIKAALRATTDEAVERGAFGAPTFFVQTPAGTEMFFGSDRFPHVARALGVEWLGPLP